MRDEILLAMSNDPENYWEDGVLYGPGLGTREVLITVNAGAAKEYAGPLPRWVTRRGLKLWDVVANQYDPGEPAMVVTPEGVRSVDSGGVWAWDEIRSDFGEDLEDFFEGLIRFNRD